MIEILIRKKIKRIEHDPFMKRIGSSVVGGPMLNEGNKYLMDYAIKNMPTVENGIMLEIGSFAGLSASFILWLAKKHGRNTDLITCDPWIYEGFNDHLGSESESIDGRNDISRISYMNYIKQAFINTHNLFNAENQPYAIEMTSDKLFEYFKKSGQVTDVFGRPIDVPRSITFAYIDGDHSFEMTESDFLNTDKYLVEKGFILFDDSIDRSDMGSARFMKKMKQNKNYKLICKNPNYLFQKI